MTAEGTPAAAAEGTRALGSITIDERCTACGACIATCPEAALRVAASKPRLVPDRCTECLACLEICPAGAIDQASRRRPKGAIA